MADGVSKSRASDPLKLRNQGTTSVLSTDAKREKDGGEKGEQGIDPLSQVWSRWGGGDERMKLMMNRKF